MHTKHDMIQLTSDVTQIPQTCCLATLSPCILLAPCLSALAQTALSSLDALPLAVADS